MIQPDDLNKPSPLVWSTGKGTDVWALFQAAMAGDMGALKRLLDGDPSLVRCHYNYRTPLYFAVRENQIGAAEYLLDRGYSQMETLLRSKLATLHNASSDGEPVAAAIRARDLPRVQALLDADPELIRKGDARSNQPIHWAVMTRQLEVIDELVSRGADLDAARQDGARPIQLTNGDYTYRGWRDVPNDVTTTPAEVLEHLRKLGTYVDINTAASIGDRDRVREILDHDPSLANRVSEYVTYYVGAGSPLKNAAARGHLDIVKLLLERGADPNLPEEGIAPKGHALYSAASNGHLEIARMLLEHGAYASPPVESSADALSIARIKKDEAMIELLCSYGSSRSVELLAYYGDIATAAAVFAANPALANDPVALENAAGQGHESFVRLMLRVQPDLATRIAVGVRAAGPQESIKYRELTELLFDHGMNANFRDWLEITPLHQFARKGDLENAALFLDHGADLHARDEDIRSTPLGWAAKFGQRAMAELLLARGAKTNLPDDPAWATPLAWAKRRRHDSIAAILKQHSATA
jgi:ankyrin repeat protein